MRRGPLLIGGLVLLVRVLTFPRTPWDAEELRFPFLPMVVISVIASVVTAVALAHAFGSVAALLFSSSAAVLVHGGSARLEVVAWMFLALALVVERAPPAFEGSRRALLLGLCTGAAVACHPPLLISMLALLFASRQLSSEATERRAAPLEIGDDTTPHSPFGHLLPSRGEKGAHGECVSRPFSNPRGEKVPQGRMNGKSLEDAGAQRTPVEGARSRMTDLYAIVPFAILAIPFVSVPEVLPAVHDLHPVRFLLHPWGSKFVALPVAACAAFGIWRKRPELDALFWFTLVHLVAGIALVDPADGARWAVPSLILVAVLASRAGWIAAAAIAALSLVYTYPILRDRVLRPSPPVEASRVLPEGAIILRDREMAPFVGGLPLDAGMRAHLDDTLPLLYVASANLKGARVFSRSGADAYGKLTRNAYRNVSILPVAHRFAPLRGVYGLEQNEAGESWRWLEADAEIALPRSATAMRIELRSPLGHNDVWINGRKAAPGINELPVTGPVRVHATKTFALRPPDTRRVAVQLVKLEYR